jgi:hypothetical protein
MYKLLKSNAWLLFLGSCMSLVSKVEVGQIYKHYNGKPYEILAVGRLTESETLQECVVYKGLYDDPEFGPNPIWIRPLAMFMEEVMINGQSVPRFMQISL